MEQKKTYLLSFFFLLFLFTNLNAQQFKYDDNWGKQGLTVINSTKGTLNINYSVTEFYLDDVEIDGKSYKSVHIPEVFLPNDAGAPDLPGSGRYIAMPQGSVPTFRIVGVRTEVIKGVEVAPAPVIPKDTDKGPLKYNVNSDIYTKDEFYPSKYVQLSDVTTIRGVDAVILGVTPFQYNPVTKELIVYKDIQIEVDFQGGNGVIGVEKYRSRWWDPLLKDIFINSNILPEVDYSKRFNTDATGYEYLIIIPDNPLYAAWADSIKNFRQQQGIKTGVVNLTQIGGNTTTAIENYINNAYNTWDIPPDAFLIMADYGTGAATGNGVTSPVYNSYCISDHIYGDVNADHMAEIAYARITAQNETHFINTVKKFLDYERNPPTNPNFYDKPITAMGWQTERWFQLCSEIINGFWTNVLGKHPVRENAIYSGTPGTSWSSNQNTSMIVNYFGPSGLNYIPATPQHLTDWGGNATRVNNDINSGAFMLSHRDHGGETLWGEPAYSISNMSGLNNNDPVFVLSMNCLTGKFNYSSECFTEAFHRYPKRALGLIAATETSYSFVNDAYAWGMFDNMWPNFMPAYGEPGPTRILPAFGNVAGKYFLKQSNWPYNTSNKEVTYYLFHHHGDAFTFVYSEIPQNLTVNHNPVLLGGVTSFDVSANEGSLIALSLNNEILDVADGTGSPVTLQIPVLTPGSEVLLTVTKQNYYRYSVKIPVIAPSGAYIVHQSNVVNDSTQTTDKLVAGNGLLDYHESPNLSITVKNLGSQTANNAVVKLRSTDPYITITDSTENYGNILPDELKMVWKGFAVTVNDTVPNEHQIPFTVFATDGSGEWTSSFTLKAYAPILQYAGYSVNDSAGNNNGKIEPGETVKILINLLNTGGSKAYNVTGNLVSNSQYLTITSGVQNYGTLDTNQVITKSFTAVANNNTPSGQSVELDVEIVSDFNRTGSGNFNVIIGQIPAIIVDFDKNHNSANIIKTAILAAGVNAEVVTTLPANLQLYSSVFVCLGTYSQNYKLTTPEGQALADYLTAGGNLYMEGGDTWYYDTKTPVHYMFNIQGVNDGSGNLNTLLGQTGSIAEGMTFSFTGENNYIDQINAVAPAVVMFKNQTPSFGTMVSYETGNYRTIGSSCEFGGFADGTLASTKDSLITRMLRYFKLIDIPVELTSLNAEVVDNSVKITWETATELNNMGFDVERSKDGKTFTKIATIEGKGTTSEKSQYTYTDNTITESGKLYYRLKQMDYDGTAAYSSIVEVDYSALPTEFSLSQNYPNPFNPATTIKFALPQPVRVTLKVYDALGSEVETLINKEMEAGYHQLEWNAGKYSSGMYIYRITAGDFNSVKKMMILK